MFSPAVNSPIVESEHHNFRCRAFRPERYFFRVSPLSSVARATKDADNCKALYVVVRPIVFAYVSLANKRQCRPGRNGYSYGRCLISAGITGRTLMIFRLVKSLIFDGKVIYFILYRFFLAKKFSFNKQIKPRFCCKWEKLI